MGFSTSGAVAVMLIAFLVAASVIVPTLFTASSQTGAAFSSQADQIRDQQNTAIDLESVEHVTVLEEVEEDEYEVLEEFVRINVTNVGSTSLDVYDTDLLVDGGYVPASNTSTGIDDGNDETEPIEETRIWSPGTTLIAEVDEETLSAYGTSSPGDVDRVKIATESGITVSTGEIEETEETDETEGGD
ncbi:flagellin [Natrarchaeobius sp. A-rgal3]|uniref:flagellin n=1 Tax=Natrarchaeobius versutus TaxID=1679078 RepID=UPI00350FE721